MRCKIAPSVLAADFAQLGAQVQETEAAGADWIHVDVMDGHFVPNISIGIPVVKALRAITTLDLDVHLMIEQPERYLAEFAHAGANSLTVHQETCPHLHRTIQQIKDLGCRAGVTINPATPLSTLEEVLPMVDLVLLMSVNPGFSGQSYIASITQKVVRLKHMLRDIQSQAELQIDGGITLDNITAVVEAGASVAVIGSSIFNAHTSITENIKAFQQKINAVSP